MLKITQRDLGLAYSTAYFFYIKIRVQIAL
jgi:hypothetical protein